MPPLEAMASGVPVITSHRSSLPEVTGEAAILLDPLNAGDLSLAIEALRSSPELRARLIEAGRVRAARFTWDETARKTLAVFEEAERST